jgi:hypothetical protein
VPWLANSASPHERFETAATVRFADFSKPSPLRLEADAARPRSSGASPGARTQNQWIKSPLLYH